MVSAADVLQSYMAEMNTWEIRCAERMKECIAGTMDFAEAAKLGMAEYTQIFERYCSPRKARPRDFHFTEPPDYDANGEVIVAVKQVSSDMVEIHTRQNYSHRKQHLFLLRVEPEGWRLVERKVLLDNGDILEASL